jgi:heat shock protein HslJ
MRQICMRWIPVGVIALLALGACARSDPERPGGPGESVPTNRTFVATSAAHGGEPKRFATGSRVEVSFDNNGRLGVITGCNSIGATARIDGGRLMVGELTMTEKACDEALTQQQDWLADLVRAGPAWKLAGNDLTLTAGPSELRLTDRTTAAQPRSLTGTRWDFSTVRNGNNASSMPAGVEAFLTIAADGAVSGRTGCNELGGKATIDGATLTLPNVVTTRRGCEGPAGEFEREMLKVFAQPLSYKIDADRLTLTAPDGVGYELVAAA